MVMLQTLVERTPVDTGLAVSNWRVGLGAPTRVEIPPYAPGRKGSTAGANRAGALAAGRARIESKRPGTEIFISNLVRYIGYLDTGSPTTEGEHMVDAALMHGQIYAESRKLF